MAEDFDVFGNLKKLDKKNILDEFKAKLAEAHSSGADENDELEIDLLLNSFEKKARTKNVIELQNKTKAIINEAENTKDEIANAKSPEVCENQPVARRTRKSIQKNETSTFNSDDQQNQLVTQRSCRNRREDKNNGQCTISDGNLMQTDHERGGRRGRRRGGSARLTIMHARRAFLAEKAARATHIDYIDLVSCPVARVEGFINLDSDEELQCKDDATTSDATSISNCNALIDEDNPEVLIKIKWGSKLETWKVRKYEKFLGIFQKIAQRENISIEYILLNIENRIISPDDTPDSIEYKVYQFLRGRILEKALNSPLSNFKELKERSKNRMVLKVQSDQWKRPKEMDLLKTDKFRILYIKCSEELNVSIEKLRLSFDGEILDHSQTPMDLDLEGNEIIDLNFKK